MKRRTKMRAEEREAFEQEHADSHAVTHLEQTGPFRLKLTFDDGTVSEIDFLEGLSTAFSGKMYAPLRDPAYFAQVYIDRNGILTWPNREDFNPAHLYCWDNIMAEFGGSKPEPS